MGGQESMGGGGAGGTGGKQEILIHAGQETHEGKIITVEGYDILIEKYLDRPVERDILR